MTSISCFLTENALTQRVLREEDRPKVLCFGPLESTLEQLYREGWFLYVPPGRKHLYNKKFSLYITRVDHRPQLVRRKLSISSLEEGRTLSSFLRQRNPLGPPNPWEQLMATYPVRPTTLVGNSTVEEKLAQAMKEHLQ